MSRRVVIGPRGNGDVGLFVSPPGVDAFTAPDASLRLSVTSKVSQLIMLGRVAAGSTTIPMGLTSRPYVFVTSQYDFSAVIGHTLGPGPLRPSPPTSAFAASSATINGGGASFSVSSAFTCVYTVYSQVF